MKQKLLSIKALVLVLMMTVGFGQAFAQDVTYVFSEASDNPGNANDWFKADIDEYTSWSATKGGNNNPKYYNTGTGLRVYKGGTFTVESTKIIESITLTFSGAGYTFASSMSNPETQDQLYCPTYSWNVSRTCRLQKIEITYYDDTDDRTPTTTTFNGEKSYTVALYDEFTSPTATVSVKDGDPIEGAIISYSSSNPDVATVDQAGHVYIGAYGTTTITADYEGDETYAYSSASYTLNVIWGYNSLQDLAGDPEPQSNDIVRVTFENVEIKNIYVSGQNKRTGIYFDIQKDENDIEIYYSSEEVPSDWVAGGTVSGTIQCPWYYYSNGSTWELTPSSGWSWSNLTYQAPAGAKTTATIEFTAKSKLEVGSADEFDVTYNGDGVLEVNSTNEDVATVAIEDGHVVVTAVAVGTTTITVSAPETDEYSAASEQYTLTVSPAKQAFDRNVHKALVAEKDGRYYAAYNTISGSNTYFAVKEVTVYNNKVYFQNDEDASDIAWNITIDDTDATKATVQNLYGDYLVLGTKTAVSLSSNENELYANENGGFYYSSTGRGFGYNSGANPTRMAGYNISTTYPVAKAMSFAGDEDAPMRITSAGWATFYAPFPVAIPEGVTAYTGTMMDDWIQLNELTEGCIPAATGVVVAKAVEGDAFVASLTPVDFVPSVPVVSCYIGNTSNANMEVEIGDYLLQKQNDVVGWYQVQGEGFKLAPYRCYLPNFQANSSRSFIGFEPVDDATGISSIATEAKTKADGKYMVNGQIVVVKAGKAYNMNGTEIK